MRNSENDELSEAGYKAFLINRGLSYFPDTITYANEMNVHNHLDSKLQYEFLLHSVRKRKRFSKWHKKEEDEIIDLLCEYYKCNIERSKEYKKILNEEQIQSIRDKMVKGGN